MTADRTLLLLQALLCARFAAYATDSAAGPLFAAALALAAYLFGPFARFTGNAPRRAALAAAALALIRFTLLPADAARLNGFFLFPLTAALSDFALLCLAGLLARPGGERFRGTAMLCAALTVGASCNVIVPDWPRVARDTRLFALAAVGLAVLHAGRGARGDGAVARRAAPRIAEGALLALALALATPVDALFLGAFPDLERLYNTLFNPDDGRGTGFSGDIALHDIEQARDADPYVALRIEARHAPGYLRGRVLPDFNSFRWSAGEERTTRAGEPLPAVAGHPPRHRFPVDPAGHPDASRTTRIHPALDERTVFLPEGCMELHARPAELVFDESGMPRFARGADLSDWIALPASGEAGTAALTPDERKRHLELHRHVRTVAVEFAGRAFAGLATTGEILAAAGSFLERDGFSYARGVRPPTGKRTLEWFLHEARRGHCEMFASAACVMLRAAGIPARLVAGFVVSEVNPLTGYYIARNIDAHAWVEAHDGTRWVRVEPTPGDGIPQGGGVPRLTALLDALRFRASEFVTGMRFGGIRFLADAAWRATVRLFALALAALPWLILLAPLGWLARRALPRRLLRHAPEGATPLAALLAAADQAAARAGIARQPAETACEFARRAEEDTRLAEPPRRRIAAWYRAWSSARWGGAAPPSPPDRAWPSCP